MQKNFAANNDRLHYRDYEEYGIDGIKQNKI